MRKKTMRERRKSQNRQQASSQASRKELARFFLFTSSFARFAIIPLPIPIAIYILRERRCCIVHKRLAKYIAEEEKNTKSKLATRTRKNKKKYSSERRKKKRRTSTNRNIVRGAEEYKLENEISYRQNKNVREEEKLKKKKQEKCVARWSVCSWVYTIYAEVYGRAQSNKTRFANSFLFSFFFLDSFVVIDGNGYTTHTHQVLLYSVSKGSLLSVTVFVSPKWSAATMYARNALNETDSKLATIKWI